MALRAQGTRRMPKKNWPHRTNYNVPGHAHELTWSCYHGYQFLSKERTCQWLVESINAAREELDFDLWAYVFMPEHVHLIVHPRQPLYEMEDIRQAIKEPCARDAIAWLSENAPEWLPRISVQKRNRVRRHFWQKGGGYDRNIEEPATLLKMIDYIHENPVRRGLVERAIDWWWSSARWYITGEPGPLQVDPVPTEWLVV